MAGMLLAVTAATIMFRCLSWNPLSISAEGRAEDLSTDTGNFYVVALQGTQRRSFLTDGGRRGHGGR